MHIIMVNGSPRKKGATAKLNAALAERLLALDPGIVLEHIELGEVRPHYCDGCLHCYRQGGCHIQDDGMEEISRRIDACDGLVLASPTYGSNVTGLFKSFIDRGHFIVEQMLRGKPCVLMTSYENAQGKQTLSAMNQVVMTSGGYSVGKIAAKVPFNESPITPQVERRMDEAARRLYRAIRGGDGKRPLFPLLFNAVAFRAVLMPHALKHPRQYRGVMESWVRRGLMGKEMLG